MPVYRLKEIKDGGFNFYQNELVKVSSTQGNAEGTVSPSLAAEGESQVDQK